MHRERHSAIIVHGGAGDRTPEGVNSGGGENARLAGARKACAAGAAVRALEDDPLFNAGTGSTLTSAGDVELDASIMDGETLRCGAVAVVRDVKNPISLARAVMERTAHVMLAGPAASAFAREAGFPPHDNALLVTPGQRARWEEARRRGPTSRTGTVGAVARDARGHLAAATSTGGTSMKRPGRVGDTPVIGAGTYADDRLAAVSCTGHGERILQVTLARHAADLVGAGRSAMDAAREAVRVLGARVGGEGGLVVVGPAGEPGFAHNTQVMSRAWVAPDGTIRAEL